ncbi:MAG: glycosyltransferase family 4 protein [Deltaproteobacteria bacterium]|nr:MAG: glycosyltransferase family 4 protein [Deltaproteobacteria bacterium]
MLRIAVLGAFPFPVPQGSQVYAAEQARALLRAGALPTLICYGRGRGPDPADLDVLRASRALSPRRLRAGPSPLKPFADLSLLAALVRAHRRRRFDVVIAHNAEAALVALAARARLRLPVVYAAHTLLARELPSYAPRSVAGPLSRIGAALDARLARRADAVLALSAAGAAALEPHARGRVAVIPPGLEPAPAPSADAIAQTCERHRLVVGGYAVYAGNLDGYQNLETLARAAARLTDVTVVVATHARAAVPLAPLRVLRVRDLAEMRALVHGAGVAVLARRIAGGFPIKLLNYMEAGRAIVAYASVADTLEHDRSAWLLPDAADDAAMARAIETLARDPHRAARLGEGARAVLASQHAWPALAARTLRLVEHARAPRSARAGR